MLLLVQPAARLPEVLQLAEASCVFASPDFLPQQLRAP
jgi:hypothetical protein